MVWPIKRKRHSNPRFAILGWPYGQVNADQPRSIDRLPAEYSRTGTVARRTATEASFIDVEACPVHVFDAIRKPFAIGHDGSDLDRVLHLRFELAARRAMIANYMHFLSELEIWVDHSKLLPHGR